MEVVTITGYNVITYTVLCDAASAIPEITGYKHIEPVIDTPQYTAIDFFQVHEIYFIVKRGSSVVKIDVTWLPYQ